MNNSPNKDRYAVVMLAFAIMIVLGASMLFLTNSESNKITGRAIADAIHNQTTSGQGDNISQIPFKGNETPTQILQDQTQVSPPLPALPGQLQRQGSGGGGAGAVTQGQPPENGQLPQTPSAVFEITRPGSNFELYDGNGIPLPPSRRFEPGKKERFAIYKDGFPLSDFDLEFNDNLDLSSIKGAVNRSLGKSFIHAPQSLMRNRTLYVPRSPGQSVVRICENAQSLDEVFEGCSQLAHITREYVLAAGDRDLRVSHDGSFFIVSGIFGTGGQSENNTRLIIYDDSDLGIKFPHEIVRFFANYSNSSNSNPISGSSAICNISISDTGRFNMTFNVSSGLYWYNRSFAGAGVYSYNVSCNASDMGFLGLTAQDYVSIQPIVGFVGGPDNISRGQSQRGTENVAGVVEQAQGGNVTPIGMQGDFITRSWQGYFGNVTNTLILSDGANNSLYSWNHAQPAGEVFASRAFDVNFASVDCATQEQIYHEEQALGQTNLSSDRVNITFNRTSHPEFSVSTTSFLANQCRSTNINVNDAYQQQRFYEVLLSDGAQNVIYTSIIDANQLGFDGTTYDFQMIVGENDHNDTAPTFYYFFVELT